MTKVDKQENYIKILSSLFSVTSFHLEYLMMSLGIYSMNGCLRQALTRLWHFSPESQTFLRSVSQPTVDRLRFFFSRRLNCGNIFLNIHPIMSPPRYYANTLETVEITPDSIQKALEELLVAVRRGVDVVQNGSPTSEDWGTSGIYTGPAGMF